jgi:predicted membrane channel-forming protein YqfA (hemolysin III family)
MVLLRRGSRNGLEELSASPFSRARCTAADLRKAEQPEALRDNAAESRSTSSDDESALSREASHLNLDSGIFSPALLQRHLSGLTRPDSARPAPDAKASDLGVKPSAPPSPSAARRASSPAAAASYPVVLVCHKTVHPSRYLRHITRGYRPDGCHGIAAALFQLHNQSFNIWSHLLGIPYVASFWWAWTPSDPLEEPYILALRLHAAVGILVGIASAFYHAGEASTRRDILLAADQGCAFVSCAAHAMLITHFELSRVRPTAAAATVLALAVAAVAGMAAFISGAMNQTPKSVVSAVMGLPNLVALAAWAAAPPTPTSPELAVWAGLFGVTVMIWVLFLPERWMPDGALNWIGNSHNIMHVMVIVVFAHIQAIYGTRLAWAAGIDGGAQGAL